MRARDIIGRRDMNGTRIRRDAAQPLSRPTNSDVMIIGYAVRNTRLGRLRARSGRCVVHQAH